MLKEEVYKDYQPLDANDDNIHLMRDPPTSVPDSAAFQGTGSGSSAQSAASASSLTTAEGFDLPLGYDSYQVKPSKRRLTRLMHSIRRITYDPPNNIYHPTLVPFEDKRIAGCLLHCVYAKNNAIDKLGWPTLDGLVDFYSEGVNEHGFFMATLRSVNLCLRAVTIKYRINRHKLPERGESCDLAFDVFDCISDQITGYCLDQYK
ncbi:general odorant-binding protein 70 [Anastrepha obliqua]|uniref:general odorant-binding protein 70 n=1 Tax=Anastrepha obliqua TaxID=95512 RepID=UPI002409DC7E|nr:general odorant-binding protein 70 [Anastrepha obliqua]XP_054732433.1 general odorant-binding protein 70 [Anastrepha obliqua]